MMKDRPQLHPALFNSTRVPLKDQLLLSANTYFIYINHDF